VNTCLITGGAGNLACQLSGLLAEKYDRLVLVDQADQPLSAVPSSACYERGDITDAVRVEDLFGSYRPAAVVHLASLLSGSCERDRLRAWQVNATGTFLLLEQALSHGVERFLFTSTVAAYGGHLPDPLTEEAPQWPDGLYGVTKVAGERLGVYYHRRHGLDFRCLRVPITISSLASPGAASALVSLAFLDAVRKGSFTFAAREDTPLAVIYAQDAVRAIAALLAASADRLTQRVYNIHAMTVTPRDIAAVIQRRLPGVELQFKPQPEVADLLASWPGRIDDHRARADWDWKPLFDLERTADHLIQEIQREPAVSRSL
jgi:threonine 3-dehydrogenase